MAIYVRKERIRAINIHYPSINSDCFLILRRCIPKKVRIVLSFHGSDVKNISRSSTVDAKRWGRFLSGVDHIVVPSDFLGEEVAGLKFTENLSSKVTVIHNGIDCDRIVTEAQHSSDIHIHNIPDEYIISIGNYVPVKDHKTLLRAFFPIADVISSLGLVVIGRRGATLEHLKEMVRKSRHQTRITLLENVSHQDAMALLSRARMLVLSSLRENSPLVLLEAAVFGIPVISTSVGGVPELITDEENGLLTAPGNIEQLSDAIKRYNTDRPFATLLADNLRKKVATSRSAAATYKSYERLFVN
jgi:glycosyltransferase involved in cell wall biosynthesis